MRLTVSLLAFMIGTAAIAGGQNPPAPASQAPLPLDVGTVAPDFALTGATRYGVLRDPVHLNDFKGKTVVLAFFFKARTRG
ncbi:MAG: hypothetical protein HYS40_03205 [Gemmatimonadetes bacterium]|nr:hypothetical protein [Gemmatimonadota bacterium]